MVELRRAYAQVFVRDIDRAVAFYRDVLGFEVRFTYGEPPFYAEVFNGGAAFNLRHTDVTPWAGIDEPDLLAVAINVSDAEALFRAYDAAGVPFHQPLREEAWGDRSFIVRDPDGNLVLFSSG